MDRLPLPHSTTDCVAPSATNQTDSQGAGPPKNGPERRLGRQCCFGMTLHVGADSKTKLIHPMTTATASEAKPAGPVAGYRGHKLVSTRLSSKTKATDAG